MLLTALAIAALKVDAIPQVTLAKDRHLQRRIRSASRRGLLNTLNLKPADAALVRKAIQAMPAHLYKENDSSLWIVDSGCSDTATGFKSDFIPGSLIQLEYPKPMDGVGGQLQATHSGTISFDVLADDGTVHPIRTTGYYLPKLGCRLMSPQSHFLEQKRLGNVKASLSMNWKGTNLTLDKGITVTIPYDTFTRLPKLRAYTNALETAESLAYACVSDERNQNLSHKAKTLLQWHFKLGHVGFQRLKWIGRQGWLGGVGERFGLSSVEAPKCAACQFGQQQRLKKEGKTTSVDTDREGILKKDKLEPGDLIFWISINPAYLVESLVVVALRSTPRHTQVERSFATQRPKDYFFGTSPLSRPRKQWKPNWHSNVRLSKSASP